MPTQANARAVAAARVQGATNRSAPGTKDGVGPTADGDEDLTTPLLPSSTPETNNDPFLIVPNKTSSEENDNTEAGHETRLEEGLSTFDRLMTDIGATIQENKEHLASSKSRRDL